MTRTSHVQAFLTGILQNYARKTQEPIDTVSYGFEVQATRHEDLTEKPEFGCYIRGLFLEGARWDMEGMTLAESRPKELFTSFPCIWLIPVVSREKPTQGIYNCPVYKTLTRAGSALPTAPCFYNPS
jgi:dynein heavy chain, axonemal